MDSTHRVGIFFTRIRPRKQEGDTMKVVQDKLVCWTQAERWKVGFRFLTKRVPGRFSWI